MYNDYMPLNNEMWFPGFFLKKKKKKRVFSEN